MTHQDQTTAHGRFPPPGYVESFVPNVMFIGPKDVQYQQRPPDSELTAERIVQLEEFWADRLAHLLRASGYPQSLRSFCAADGQRCALATPLRPWCCGVHRARVLGISTNLALGRQRTEPLTYRWPRVVVVAVPIRDRPEGWTERLEQLVFAQ